MWFTADVFWASVGNRLLTILSNCLTDINLSHMETCCKVFRRKIVYIPIEENRSGFEPKISIKVAKRWLPIYEVGISYWGAHLCGRKGDRLEGRPTLSLVPAEILH